MNVHYEVAEVLDKFDAFYPPLIIGLIVTMAAFYLYYWKGIRQGFKDKCGGMPWQTNMYNFANDCVYVCAFWSWFGPDSPTHHWSSMVLWVGLALWFVFEFVIHYQSIKWDLQTEIFPHAKSRKNAIAMYWGVQACFVAGYAFIWSMLDDPLVHCMFITTYFGCVIFNFGMSAKRGSRRGMAPSVPYALAIAQFFGFFVILPSLSASFANPITYFMGVVAVGLAIAYIVVYRRLPKYEPEPEAAVSAPVGAKLEA